LLSKINELFTLKHCEGLETELNELYRTYFDIDDIYEILMNEELTQLLSKESKKNLFDLLLIKFSNPLEENKEKLYDLILTLHQRLFNAENTIQFKPIQYR